MFRSACLVLLLLGAVAGWLHPLAWGQDRKPVVDVTLTALMQNPGQYVGREVRFLCRFAMHGSLYRRQESAFTEERDLNFAVWDMHARLWEEEARKDVSPAFYLARQHPHAESIQAMKRYQAVEVTARVVSDYARIPWMRVEDVTQVQDRDYRLDGDALTLFRRGVAAMEAEAYDRAAGLLAQAHGGELPRTYREELRARLDQCMAQLGADPIQETASHATPAPATHTDESKTAPPAPHAYLLDTKDVDPMRESGIMNPTREKALRVTMTDVRAARALVLQKNYVEAAHAYGRAIAAGSPLAGAGWLRKEIGQLYESRYDARGERSDLEIAFREFRKADEIAEGQDAEARGLLARTALKRAAYDPTLHEAAETYAQDALRLQPDAVATRFVLAEIWVGTGRVDEARNMLQSYPLAGESLPATEWMLRGRIAEAEEQTSEARAAYERVTQLQPTSRVAWERFAAMAEATQAEEAAAEAYATLIGMRPGHLPYRLAMGRVLLRIGQESEAAVQLQFAMGADGETGQEARTLLAAHAARAADDMIEEETDTPEHLSAMQAPEGLTKTGAMPVTSIRMESHTEAEGNRHLPVIPEADAAKVRPPMLELDAGRNRSPSDTAADMTKGHPPADGGLERESPATTHQRADHRIDESDLPDWAR